jgi:F0F1-type ATP synthase assembly protein I
VPADLHKSSPQTRAHKALYEGFGNALGTAFELAGVTVIFALFGLWLDSIFDTRPLWLLVLTMLAIVGLAVRSYYTYKAEMEAEEARRPTWKRS